MVAARTVRIELRLSASIEMPPANVCVAIVCYDVWPASLINAFSGAREGTRTPTFAAAYPPLLSRRLNRDIQRYLVADCRRKLPGVEIAAFDHGGGVGADGLLFQDGIWTT